MDYTTTYTRHGTEYCKFCDIDLTMTRKMELAHECDRSDLYRACGSLRDTLEKICKAALVQPDIGGIVALPEELINEGRDLLGLD